MITGHGYGAQHLHEQPQTAHIDDEYMIKANRLATTLERIHNVELFLGGLVIKRDALITELAELTNPYH